MHSQSRKKALRETAAIWFYRLQDMAMDDPDRSRFEAWLMENPAHQAAYQEVEQVSQKLNSMHAVDQLSAALKNQHKTKRSNRLKTTITALSVLLFASVGLIGYQHWQAQPVLHMAAVSTVGEMKTQQLEDGSKIIINSKSDLEITYYRDKRLAKLKHGEVIFEVARDENRPFIVDSGTAKITVLGTRFAVNHLKNLVRVSVDHGRVRVEAQDAAGNALAQPVILNDHQVAEVVQHSQPRKVERSAEDGFSFEQGIISFDNADLAEITETIARYRVKPIVVDAVDGDAPHISARVSAGNVEGFLSRLPKLMPVNVKHESGKTIITGQKKN
ncbi:MAG: FecR family protein [Methylophilus sp.]|uniref:FecR family protein n=1 Tax=Methylophilus sp. TaxID=29541 RepID=UPI003FA1137C